MEGGDKSDAFIGQSVWLAVPLNNYRKTEGDNTVIHVQLRELAKERQLQRHDFLVGLLTLYELGNRNGMVVRGHFVERKLVLQTPGKDRQAKEKQGEPEPGGSFAFDCAQRHLSVFRRQPFVPRR